MSIENNNKYVLDKEKIENNLRPVEDKLFYGIYDTKLKCFVRNTKSCREVFSTKGAAASSFNGATIGCIFKNGKLKYWERMSIAEQSRYEIRDYS